MKKFLFVILTMASSAQLVCNNISWSFPPTTLSTANLAVSNPQIATDSNGNAVAVWVENGYIKARTKPVSMNWGSLVVLSGASSSSPNVVSDLNGNITVVWIQSGVVMASSKTPTGNWAAPSTLSNGGATSTDLAVNSAGDVVAVWPLSGDIQAITKLFGSSWGTHFTISSSNASNPVVAMGGTGSNRKSVLIWNGVNGSVEVVYSAVKQLTGPWSAQQAISNPLRNAAFGDVAMDSNGDAAAVWYEFDNTNGVFSNVVLQTACRPSSGAWGAGIPLSSPGLRDPSTLTSSVAYDATGNIIALWNTSFDDSTFTIQAAIKPIYQPWVPSVNLVTANLYAYDFDLSVNSFGDALACYMFYNGGAQIIQSSESTINGFMENQWSVPLNLSQAIDNAFPSVASSSTGNLINAAAVWIASNGTSNSVVASTGSRSLVLPASGLSVVQSVNNFGVFSEYLNKLSWNASTDPNIAGYIIFRNGVLIQQVDSTVLQIVDHNQVQDGSVTYGVAAINAQQYQSQIVTVSYP